VRVGDDYWHTHFGKGIDMRIVGCCVPTGGSWVEDDVLGSLLLGDIVLETEKSLLSIEFVAV
jgi:hypothetical protein